MSARKKTTTERPTKNTTTHGTKTATTRPTESATPPTPEPTTNAPVLRTDSDKALWTALGTHPGFTAAELAGAARISGSTARRILTGWATSGAARRDRDPDNPRAAERWSPATTAPAAPADTVTEPEAVQPDAGSENVSTATESDDDVSSDAVPGDAAPATGTPVPPEPATARGQRAETTAPATDTPDSGADAAAAQQESPERLAPGALRGQVEDHLRDAPEKEFTPHEIGKSLGRSSGAVHNALLRLTTLGTARKVSDRPKKFALAAGQ
ncbi:hypothetical protein [Nocardia vaccinii]|uniref:hypothetical protein n=1 Tax=Nocardia vaccinii TaxID=1822 RepID=UPI000832D98F|nr:hypothetical protein [Nocardia vaccinii]